MGILIVMYMGVSVFLSDAANFVAKLQTVLIVNVTKINQQNLPQSKERYTPLRSRRPGPTARSPRLKSQTGQSAPATAGASSFFSLI